MIEFVLYVVGNVVTCVLALVVVYYKFMRDDPRYWRLKASDNSGYAKDLEGRR